MNAYYWEMPISGRAIESSDSATGRSSRGGRVGVAWQSRETRVMARGCWRHRHVRPLAVLDALLSLLPNVQVLFAPMSSFHLRQPPHASQPTTLHAIAVLVLSPFPSLRVASSPRVPYGGSLGPDPWHPKHWASRGDPPNFPPFVLRAVATIILLPTASVLRPPSLSLRVTSPPRVPFDRSL